MGHSFIHHFLCSCHPGTRFDSQFELLFANSPRFLNWRTEEEATGIVGEKHKEQRENGFSAHIWIYVTQCPEYDKGIQGQVAWVGFWDVWETSNVQRVSEHEWKSLAFKQSTTTIQKNLFFFTKLTDLTLSGKFSSCSFILRAKVLVWTFRYKLKTRLSKMEV